MNADSVNGLSVFLFYSYAVVGIQDQKIFPAEIRGISVDKAKVPVFSGEGLYAVTGGDADLEPVVCHKVVVSPAHDFVGGVVEKVIQIKFQYPDGRKIVIKHFLPHIDGSAEIDAVVPEIGQTDPLFKRQRRGIRIVFRKAGGIGQDSSALPVGGMGVFRRGKSSQTDMFSSFGER